MTIAISQTTAATPSPFAGLVVICPWVKSYTGSQKLNPQDIGLTAADLPPKDLASLGAMNTCDPKLLQPFETARNSQMLACLEFGTRGLGGYLVPKHKAADVAKKLDAIKGDFYAYKADFLVKFEAEREKWIKAPSFAKWTDRIRERLHPLGYIDGRIQCGYAIVTIGDLADLGDPSLAAGAIEAAAAVGDSALEDVAVLAKALIRESFMDDKGVAKTEVTQKILRPFRRMQDKIVALSFHDPRLKDVGDYIAKVLAGLPQQGKMTGLDLDAIYGLALRMSDPVSMLAVAAISGTSVELDADAQLELVAMTTPPPAPQVVVDSTPVFDDAAPAAPAVAPAPALDAVLGVPVYDEC